MQRKRELINGGGVIWKKSTVVVHYLLVFFDILTYSTPRSTLKSKSVSVKSLKIYQLYQILLLLTSYELNRRSFSRAKLRTPKVHF